MPRLRSAFTAFAASLSVVPASMAQVPGTPRNGPDVVVGNLLSNDPSNLTLDRYTPGTAALLSYGVGTLSCNYGTVPLAWRADTNDHPVITQNMFRLVRVGLANGNLITRVEQVGQAWLKHGFTALQGSECLTCQPFPNGSALGVGCSDPYSASLNGTQIGLGPKSEVNPVTGAFPFPWTLNPSFTGATARRLQVSRTDLVDPGLAGVFVESQYIAPDDAAAGNDNNNNSYRRVSVSGATLDLTLTDTPRVGRPAIYAWFDYGQGINAPDPDVTLAVVDVPGDGRFIVGCRVTDRGGGVWNYEYAIQNIQSDRAGGSFTVPVPAGAAVSGTGFRGVAYHSGEVYSNADWTVNVSGTGVRWQSPQTFVQNPNTNALRWGTLYNFRFDAAAAPAMGTVELGLFKPGQGAFSGVAAVMASLPTPGGASVGSAPANDECGSAWPLVRDSFGFTSALATAGGPGACVLGGTDGWGADVWFRYTWPGPCAGNLTFSTCGSAFDTRLAVYAGSTCPTAPGTALVCSDDAAGPGECGAGSTASSVTIAVTPGQTFLIRVGGTAGARGQGILNVRTPVCAGVTGACCFPSDGSCSLVPSSTCIGLGGTYRGDGTVCVPNPCPPPARPANDLCASARAIGDVNAGAQSLDGTTVNATVDGGETGCGGLTAVTPDVWYTYVPAVNGTVTVDLCQNGAFDSVLSVRRGSACGGTVEVGCNDDSCSSQSRVQFTGAAGQRYYFRVSGYSASSGTPGETGTFTIRVTGGGGVVPTNDTCAGRAGVGLGTITFDTSNTNTDGPSVADCAGTSGAQVDRDVFYNFPAQSSGVLTVSACGTLFPARVAVYSGSSCTDWESRLLACGSSTGACPAGASVSVNVVAGQSYTIRVGGSGGGAGPGQLTLSLAATGACCSGATCTVVSSAACTGANTSFKGAGSVCNALGNTTTPCCLSDFRQDGVRTPADLFAFLRAYFARSTQADIDGSGDTSPLDVTLFLEVYFAGGC
jgi:hypothetical protein